MPNKTADDLARILSLSSASSDERAAPGPSLAAERLTPPLGFLRDASSSRAVSPGLSLFYDFGETSDDVHGGTRERFNSKVMTVIAS